MVTRSRAGCQRASTRCRFFVPVTALVLFKIMKIYILTKGLLLYSERKRKQISKDCDVAGQPVVLDICCLLSFFFIDSMIQNEIR